MRAGSFFRRSVFYGAAGTLYIWTLLTLFAFVYFPVYLDKKAVRGPGRATFPWLGVGLLLVLPLAYQAFESLRARNGPSARIPRQLLTPMKSVVLNALIWSVLVSWNATGRVVWDAGLEWAGTLYFLYWVTAGVAGFAMAGGRTDLAQLSGCAQILARLKGEPEARPRMIETSLYRYSRHPAVTYLAVSLWLTPLMTLDRFIWALLWTGCAIAWVERLDRRLLEEFGSTYADYQSRVPKWLPFTLRGRRRRAK